MYGQMARHKDYTVVYMENSDVGLVKHVNTAEHTDSDMCTVRDMALKIRAHGSLEEWLASFVRRGGIGYRHFKHAFEAGEI